MNPHEPTTWLIVYGAGAAAWLVFEGFTLSAKDFLGIIIVRTLIWPASALIAAGRMLRWVFG